MVLVEGSRIVAAGPDVPIPEGANVIDLGDATLAPGFIDAHTHLTGEYNDDWNRAFVNGFRREVAEQAIGAAVNARAVVEAGFTTVRDVGSGDLVDIGLRNSIARGLVPGPRMLVAVHTLGARGGHADRNGIRHDLLREDGPAEGIAHGPAGFREAVRFQVKYGADVIKFCASGGVLSLSDEVDTPQLTREEMSALIDEAHRLRKKVAAHCHGALGVGQPVQGLAHLGRPPCRSAVSRPSSPIRSRSVSIGTTAGRCRRNVSTARWWAMVNAHVARGRSGSYRAALRHTSRNVRCSTSSASSGPTYRRRKLRTGRPKRA